MPSMLVIDGALRIIDAPAARTRGARLRTLADSFALMPIGSSKRQKRSETAEPPTANSVSEVCEAIESQTHVRRGVLLYQCVWALRAQTTLPPPYGCDVDTDLPALELTRAPRPPLSLTAAQESIRHRCL